jgi:tungstate transport system substrate-binding protein
MAGLVPATHVFTSLADCQDVDARDKRGHDGKQAVSPNSALAAIIAVLLMLSVGHAQGQSIVVASTTSTQDSGLFGYLLPLFKQKTGIDVKVVAQGTGQALDTARRGDADVVFVHAKAAEEKFLAEGFGVRRYPVMYNDFVLIGPRDDPAGLNAMDIGAALQTIKRKAAPFISRADRSGTHIAEVGLWRDAGIDIATEKGRWYREIGQGMGAALNMAAALNAYVLSDRGTWLAFKNRGDLAILVEGDKRLFNQYGVMLVNPAKHPSVKKEIGQQFIEWLISPEGQNAIAGYKINGQQLFYPNANDPTALLLELPGLGIPRKCSPNGAVGPPKAADGVMRVSPCGAASRIT